MPDRTIKVTLVGDADQLNKTFDQSGAKAETLGARINKGMTIGGAALAGLGAGMLKIGDTWYEAGSVALIGCAQAHSPSSAWPHLKIFTGSTAKATSPNTPTVSSSSASRNPRLRNQKRSKSLRRKSLHQQSPLKLRMTNLLQPPTRKLPCLLQPLLRKNKLQQASK